MCACVCMCVCVCVCVCTLQGRQLGQAGRRKTTGCLGTGFYTGFAVPCPPLPSSRLQYYLSSQGCLSPCLSPPSPSQICLSPSQGCLSPSQGCLSPSLGCLSPSLGYLSPSLGYLSPSLSPSQGYLSPYLGCCTLPGLPVTLPGLSPSLGYLSPYPRCLSPSQGCLSPAVQSAGTLLSSPVDVVVLVSCARHVLGNPKAMRWTDIFVLNRSVVTHTHTHCLLQLHR